MKESWIWITGCASGLGKHLATELVNKGYSILATDIDIIRLEQAQTEQKWPSDRVRVAALDITQLAHWQTLYREQISQGKIFSHLLNVAGFIEPGSGHRSPATQMQKHLNINVMGMVNGCDTLLPHFKENEEGHIINIASFAGIAPVPGVVAYSASKAAARSFSNSLALELKLDNLPVAVTCVCPDLIATPMMEKQLNYGEHSRLVFSGDNVLTLEQVSKLILGKVWKNKPVEVATPFIREWQVRLISLFPNISQVLYRHLAEKGRKNLQTIRRNSSE